MSEVLHSPIGRTTIVHIDDCEPGVWIDQWLDKPRPDDWRDGTAEGELMARLQELGPKEGPEPDFGVHIHAANIDDVIAQLQAVRDEVVADWKMEGGA